MLSETQALERLREFVARHETQKQAAEELGISAVYLSDILGGRRGLSSRVAERIGLQQVRHYASKPEAA